jgi:hypothetical protein
MAGSGITAINGLSADVQTFAMGTNGTDFNISSASSTHTFNLPTASALNRGLLSTTDWNTFNSKVSAATTLTINGVTYDLSANRSWTVAGGISGSGAAGQVSYWDGTTSQAGSNNLFWDAANGRLGIGTNAPATDLHINSTFATTSSLRLTRSGVSATDAVFEINNGTSGAGQFLPQFLATSNFFNAGNSTTVGVFFQTRITNANSGDVGLIFDARRKPDGSNPFGSPLTTGWIASFRSFSTDYVRIAHNGNMLLQNGGTFTDSGQRLQVQGTTLLNGNVTFSSSTGMTWDATNSRLGIGTSTPTNDLSIVKTSAAAGEVGIYLRNLTASGSAFNAIYNDVNESGAFQIFGSTFAATSFRNTLSVLSTTANGIAFLTNSNNANAHIKFVTTTSLTERMRIVNSTGNVLIQNGGTFTDSGERLQVTGDVKVVGSGATSATNALMVRNSSNTALLQVRNNGNVVIGAGNQGIDTTLLNISGSFAYLICTPASGYSAVFGTYSSFIASAVVQCDSTTRGFLPPRMTTTQKNAITSPAAGLVVYDTTLNKLCVYTTAWETITSI